MDTTQLPWFSDIAKTTSLESFQNSRTITKHVVDKLDGEVVLVVGDRARLEVPSDPVAYLVREFVHLKRLDAEALREAHEVKRIFGGYLTGPAPPPPPPLPHNTEDRRKAIDEAAAWVFDDHYIDRLWDTMTGKERIFLDRLFGAAGKFGFPTLTIRWVTLHGEAGWREFCGHPGTCQRLQEAAWKLLAALKQGPEALEAALAELEVEDHAYHATYQTGIGIGVWFNELVRRA